MTRYEKLKEDFKNDEWWLKDVELDNHLHYCPHFLDCGEDDLEELTMKEDFNGKILGCRGISCEECWNKEYKEEI